MEYVRMQMPDDAVNAAQSALPETPELVALMRKIEENTARAAKGRNVRNILLAVCALGLVAIALVALLLAGRVQGALSGAQDAIRDVDALVQRVDMDKILKLADDVDDFILAADSMLDGINEAVIEAKTALSTFSELDVEALNNAIRSLSAVVGTLDDAIATFDKTIDAIAGFFGIS